MGLSSQSTSNQSLCASSMSGSLTCASMPENKMILSNDGRSHLYLVHDWQVVHKITDFDHSPNLLIEEIVTIRCNDLGFGEPTIE